MCISVILQLFPISIDDFFAAVLANRSRLRRLHRQSVGFNWHASSLFFGLFVLARYSVLLADRHFGYVPIFCRIFGWEERVGKLVGGW